MKPFLIRFWHGEPDPHGWLGFWRRKVTYLDRSDPIHAEYILAYGACFLVYLGVITAIIFAH